MNAEGFKNWLLASGLKKSTAENRVANCATVEREQHVDLDVCYVNDRCEHLIDLLTYSHEDKRRNRPPRHSIPIDGDVYNGAATYKAAVKKYVAFKDAGEMVRGKPISPKKVPPKVESKSMVSDSVKDKKNAADQFKTTLQKFRRWLSDEDRIPRSAGSYVSYIKSLRNVVNQKFGPGWFERIMFDDDIGTSREKRFCCSAFIEAMVRSSKGSNRKNWQNWRSGFNKFEEFLDYGTDSAEGGRDEPGEARNIAQGSSAQGVRVPVAHVISSLSYVRGNVPVRSLDHRELFNKFKSRLTTQRRWYPDIHANGVTCGLLFSPKLIGKVFGSGRNSFWNRWLKTGIESIHVLCSATGEYVLFSDVMRIDIYGDCRFIVTKKDGTLFELWTKTRTGTEKEKDVLCNRGETAPDWSDITIDHIIPLENVIREHVNDLRGLLLLSKKFEEFNGDQGGLLNGRKDDWVNDLYGRYREELNTNGMRNLLAADLEIIGQCGYELMDLRENSGKGKKHSEKK